MKITEFPFNLELLVGSIVEWIPSKTSSFHCGYETGKRWYYMIREVKRGDHYSLYITPTDGKLSFTLPLEYAGDLEIRLDNENR